MLKLAQTGYILKVMRDKDKIRNVGILAHIDHGKTTLTDLLLAEAGLIPYSLAGEIRVLDYLEEEQRRGITIKNANISLLYKLDGEDYVVNIVDTPGHVDFTGRVTRALRAVDGAVVLVDAVEEIMAQTEVVLRQALGELVKPVLFINKVDRLIGELKLGAEGIRAKISRIIQTFNDLIEIYGEPGFKDDWKVSFSRGNVIVGSALHRWGLTFKVAKEGGIKFGDIIKAYQSGDLRGLQRTIPLSRAVLEVIVRNLPSPIIAQRYRMAKIWRGKIDSKVGRAMVECDPNGPMMICITGVKVDPKEGLVATGRIFSGEVRSGSKVYLLGAKREGIIKNVSIYMGPFRENVDSLDSGNIAALSGLEFVSVGETIVDIKYRDEASPFEEITYPQEPVITVSIEPKDPRDLERLMNALKLISIEDPSLSLSVDRETGEILLSGIGELHIDIALKTLREYEPNLEVMVSEPMISYRESICRRGALVTVRSSDGLNQISVEAEPLSGPGETAASFGRILYIDNRGNHLVDLTGKAFSEKDLTAIVDGFKWACQSGPLCGEPLKDIVVKVVDLCLSSSQKESGYSQIMPAVRKAVFESLLTADPALLEPVYNIQVIAPAELIGGITNLIVRRRGKISSVCRRDPLIVVRGFIPAAESMKLADELRSTSSGRALWQCRFSHWERVPADLAPKIISALRLRRGLAAELPI